jgi:hypothetical protein
MALCSVHTRIPWRLYVTSGDRASSSRLTDCPRTVQDSTLQGPQPRSIPDLHFAEDIPLLIEFYNENNDPFPLGSVVICLSTVSFHGQTTGFPLLSVQASGLNVVHRSFSVKFPSLLFHSLTPEPLAVLETLNLRAASIQPLHDACLPRLRRGG